MSLSTTQLNPSCGETQIDPIRVELLSTEMPIHQLAKRGGEEIRILKRGHDGQIKIQWRIDYNPKVGRPGQLAYHLDTWVIKKRLSELRRPFPRLVRIGDLRQIARELDHGADTNAVRQAFDQNAATFIRAKVTYKTTTGGEESLEGYFNRYNVFYRGTALPGGRRAETVYISLNDPFYALVNQSNIRPLDFSYLRQLTPAAQRFYELLSPRIFAALRNRNSTAWIRYSDYCQHAVQKPQLTRTRMQAQMAAIHRPHRRSGYIASVAYRPSPTADGSLDWILEYEPGPRAREEYQAFNWTKARRKPVDRAQGWGKPRNAQKSPLQGSRGRNSGRPETESARFLARRFAEQRHGALPTGDPTPRQIDWARMILDAVGGDLELAQTAVDLAAKEGGENPQGFPAHMSGILEAGYLERVRRLRQKERDRRERREQDDREQARRLRYNEWCKQRAAGRIDQLSGAERRILVAERLHRFANKNHFFLSLPSWPEQRKRSWAERMILQEFGRDGEPRYEEWCRQQDEPALQ